MPGQKSLMSTEGDLGQAKALDVSTVVLHVNYPQWVWTNSAAELKKMGITMVVQSWRKGVSWLLRLERFAKDCVETQV